jgi:hypothetical protein
VIFLTRVFVAFLLIVSAAFAEQGTNSQLITSIQAGQALGFGSPAVVITFASTNSGTLPSCVTASGNKSFALDPNTAPGHEAIALAEAAFLQGKTVKVGGAGQCTIYSGVEDLGFLYTTS